jgi:multisubunit Na+/H+ antiporter MnhB subunit
MKFKIVAIVLCVFIVYIIGARIFNFAAFTLGEPSGTTIAPNFWDQIGKTVGDWLWSYRVIDVLAQAVLLFAAVIGASALFRSMRKEES